MILLLFGFCVIATLYTVQDAMKRGMNARGWGLFVAFTTGAGLPVYLLARHRGVR
ncbi:MAG: hypothetical protein AAF943_05450 [Pseudomonadota bacterium]